MGPTSWAWALLTWVFSSAPLRLQVRVLLGRGGTFVSGSLPDKAQKESAASVSAGVIIKRRSGEIPCPLAVEAFAAHLSYICKYDDKYSK